MSFILSGQCEASQTFLFWNKATCHSALLCTGSHALLLWVSIAVPHLFVTTTAAKGLNRQTFPFSDAGNANVSHALQAEMQGCTVVRQLDVVTSALCASSADIWILDQASSSSTLMALASSNEHCSRQQVNHIADPSIWCITCISCTSLSNMQGQHAISPFHLYCQPPVPLNTS